MEPFRSPAREVPVDVLPPIPSDAHRSVFAAPGEPPLSGLKTFYHPGSGVAILGIDFVVFGTELLTGFLDTPAMCVVAFLVTFPIVFMIQRKWSLDRNSAAFGKAFVGAFMAGLPFSIAGTIYGTAILMLSGLPHHPVEMLRRAVSGQKLVGPK
jgi:hypothetical protein